MGTCRRDHPHGTRSPAWWDGAHWRGAGGTQGGERKDHTVYSERFLPFFSPTRKGVPQGGLTPDQGAANGPGGRTAKSVVSLPHPSPLLPRRAAKFSFHESEANPFQIPQSGGKSKRRGWRGAGMWYLVGGTIAPIQGHDGSPGHLVVRGHAGSMDGAGRL